MQKEKIEKYWIGFDLGGTKMMATVYNGDFKKMASIRKKTKAQEGAKQGLERIAETIREALKEAVVDQNKLSGIGIGCPGPLDLDKGIILETPNLGWKDVEIKKFLEREFSCPTVLLNDVDAGTYGEYRFGAGKMARCVLGVFAGTGIGGGCVYDGQIIRGKHSSCMEIGHLKVISDGPFCGCGKKGCLEAVAGRLAIAAAVAIAACRGEAPHLFQLVGTDLTNIKSGTIAEAIRAGDKSLRKIVERAASYIGTAVAGAINLLAPDIVVLGGGMVESMPDIFIDAVEKSAQKRVMNSFEHSFKVYAASLGDDSTAMGAAAWAEEMAKKIPPGLEKKPII